MESSLSGDRCEAYNRIELIEATAKTTFICEITGDKRNLTSDQIDLIDKL